MKTIKYLFTFIGLVVASLVSQAQEAKVHLRDQPTVRIDTFRVYGICGQCKRRILSTLKTGGIRSAYWDEESNILTVQYDSKLIRLEAIHALLASAGHDTEKLKAKDTVYNALPECCHYRRA